MLASSGSSAGTSDLAGPEHHLQPILTHDQALR
jgi:hypothetical protein